MGVLDSLSPISIGGGASKERTKTDTQRQLEREVETGKRPTRQFMQAFDTMAFMGNMPASFGFGTLGPDSRFNQALTGPDMAGEPTALEQRRRMQSTGANSFMSPYGMSQYGMDPGMASAGLRNAMAVGSAGMPTGMNVGVPIVVTQSEYDALPPGSEYEGEDGEIFMKPGGGTEPTMGGNMDTGLTDYDNDFLENLVRGTY